MAKIVRSDKAPEGTVRVSIGSTSFKVDEGGHYETDDLDVIAYADSDEYLDVEYDDGHDTKAEARAEAKEQIELQKEQARVDKQRAEKDPEDPALPRPQTIEELRELKDQKDGNN